MGKHVRKVVLAILLVGWTALPTYAGITTIAPPGGLSIAFEALPTATGATFTLASLEFQNFQFINVANVIRVDLTNATFVAGTYNICNFTTGVQDAQFNVPAGTSTVNFQITTQVAPNEGISITSGACAAGPLPFAFHIGTNPTNAAVTITQFGVNGVLDQGTAVSFVTVLNQYSAGVNASTHQIDVLSGTGANFTPQTGTSATGVLGVPPIVMADSRQGTNVANPFSIAINVAALTNPVAFFGLGAVATVTVGDSQSFQGVQKVFIAAGGTNCDSTAATNTPANVVSSVNNPTGSSLTLTLPAGANGFDASTLSGVGGQKLFRLCVLTTGTTFLNPRTITANVDVTVTGGIGCCNHSQTLPTGALAAQIWQLNGGDIRISGVRADAATNNNTLINLNNLGSVAGPIVLLQVFRTQTTADVPVACELNTAAVGLTLNGNGGKQLTAQQINALCLAQAADLNTIVYAVRLVLGIAPGNLSVNAFRQFPTGVFLELPVLKLGQAFANE